MLRYPQLVARSAAFALAGGACFAAGPLLADGVAVFASLTDEAAIEQTKARLIADLAVSVERSQLDINGTSWIRLHSAIMPDSAARGLVSRAQRAGYSAWYNGTGDSLVTSSSAAAARAATRPAASGALVDDPSLYTSIDSEGDSDIVTPATGDISHLPLAETFPDIGPQSN